MEFDSQSQCSEDGTEILSENGDLYQDFSFSEDNQPQFLEAKVVYLLMQKNIPVSRATRVQWLLDHLNTTITPSQRIMEPSSNLEVISAIPREQTNMKCNRFLVTHRTELKFLAHSYRFIYCLDMSPSHANVDIQKGEILLDEILNCFKSSLCGLCKEFIIPGNEHIFSPSIYLTVIANTPFFMSPAQQVLVKGVLLTPDNQNEVIKYVEKQFHLLEGKLADVSATALDQLNFQRAQSEVLVGSLFDVPETGKLYSRIPMVSPDVNFVNMLRYSMLAITLLPENSISHILVITDGIVAMPDSNIMETLLFQLHYDSIAVSFLKVGSSFHPHSSAGFVSYTDLLHFFSRATLGCCLENFIQVGSDPSLALNIYHELFLLWSFHHINRYTAKYCDTTRWDPANDTFCSHKVPTLLSKRQTDENTSASILLLIYRRIREGFTVDSLYCSNGNLEIKLILQWKSSIYLHYKLCSQWPSIKNSTHFEVCVSAPYEFFHDITSKESKSLYRQAIIERFWLRLSQLSQGDSGLAQQLSCFQNNKDWYTLPESIRNGIPVFILNNSGSADGMKLMLTPSDPSYPKFVNIWQPVCQMETGNWRKWLHVHKVSLILRHDHPLPKYLHLANSSQRYQVVQCRQAAAALYGYLAEWASFILIDNHTYLKLLTKESGKPPVWFCIVRVSSKFPCVVLNIGFTTGTPSQTRFEVCEQLKHEISVLCYSSNPVKMKENLCCVLLQKPLEKILIRYERIPNNYTTVVFPDGTQPPHTSCLSLPSPVTGSLFTTLSRYLFHKRWIWSATLQANPKLPDNSISRILSTLTNMRLREGYSFAHSSSGIITMVIELWMEPTATCIVQYVLFPPHCCLGDDIYSGSEEDNEQSSDSEAELQMVTEVWIEPQYGKVVPNNPRISYIDNKAYYEIADAICKVDLQCISSLLTMEHLSLMCQEKSDDRFNLSGTFNNISQITVCRKSYSRRNSKNSYLESPSILARSKTQLYPITSPRIEHMPFKFDPISILPVCQQTELTFSMFIEARDKSYIAENSADKSNKLLLENILEHLALIHDQELELTKEDSDRFTQEVLLRHKNTSGHTCPISENVNCRVYPQEKEDITGAQWRCFIKGVSETHVILTFIAASIDDLKSLLAVDVDHTNIPSLTESLDSTERASSRCSNFSDVPITSTNSVCLPIYVFDCPLRGLVNAYINNQEDVPPADIYEDHMFKHGDISEECIKLKEDCDIPSEPKEDNDNHNSVRQHCKTLIVTHSKCFTISLFIALHRGIFIHSYDVQSAIDQCEESITEIDITEYIMTVCAHVKQLNSDHMLVKDLNQAHPCYELKKLHNLIKEKFFKMLNTVFYPIPTNSEYYFFKNLKNAEPLEEMSDSDDEVSENPSEVVFKSEISIYSEGPHLLQRLESGISGISEVNSSEVEPLFLHLICTLRCGHGEQSHTSVRVIPTCLGELIQNLDPSIEFLDKNNIRVTLDMLCLTLPSDVENIINDYSSHGMRTTSFCSDGFPPNVASNVSEASFIPEISEPLKRLSENQMKSVLQIRDEIKWLLRDEICTALLDQEPVSTDTLNYVIKHVSDGTAIRSSCVLDHINLNFVYATAQSYEKFLEEFKNLSLVCGRYKLCQEQDLFYLAKDPKVPNTVPNIHFMRAEQVSLGTNPSFLNLGSGFGDDLEGSLKEIFTSNEDNRQESSQPSEISSMNESAAGTDGYEDDDEYEDYDWLTTLDDKRPHLSNFWLILKITQDVVTIYFHCRFLELPTYRVGVYIEVQRAVRESVRDLCKRVNQLLLLQSLYDTKTCDSLLEPDDCSECNSPISRSASFARLKGLDVEEPTDFDMMIYSTSLSEASLNLKPGYFSCPVVWETPFILHPRLKTGPGKSGISRGILALKTILDKFSVLNRNNMFVYKDNQNNVFYLRETSGQE
ncbi:unnamed protein product [Acanthoscelides obtectus]|uniref:SZT2 n=1 Tax=Acanthoscelides obtectus TaxID=200917 RepID=A0A9P0KVZ7_ACAOB|nr:unnamed protein product [Acanthoscelides obtectus]CAK1628516.1 KICSTOR complex protein SZT2 [Acanthoscelides obtectus]